jgi:hypothetical protein
MRKWGRCSIDIRLGRSTGNILNVSEHVVLLLLLLLLPSGDACTASACPQIDIALILLQRVVHGKTLQDPHNQHFTCSITEPVQPVEPKVSATNQL